MWHFTFFQRFSSTVPREQPGPARSFNSARGLHWFPLPLKLFQRFSREGHTRSHSEHGSQASLRRWYLAPGPGKSSLPSPMVPGPRARESRAPLDSRPPEGKPSGGLFLCPRQSRGLLCETACGFLYFVRNVLHETNPAFLVAAVRVVVCDSCVLWNGDFGHR